MALIEKYIALLRGVNVGGKNKISMPALKIAFEEIGFLDVITYINSGNIIFSSDIKNESELIRICESAIVNTFKLNIPVTVISAKDLSDTLKNAPDWWDTDNKEVYDNAIFWSASLKTFSKTRWSKIASSSVNNNVTIRNANTAKKLLELAEK